MERIVNGTTVAYKADEKTIYVITQVTDVAGLLAASSIHTNVSEHIDEIYEDSGLSKLIFFVQAENTDYRTVAKKLGFKQEGRLKKATPDGDLIIFGQYR